MLPFFLALNQFWNGIRAGLRDPEFQALLTLALSLIAIGTVFYHGVEGWTWFNAFYFSTITLTTVSFGDLYPHSGFGKLFTMIYLLLGIGILLSLINAIALHAITENQKNPGRISRYLFGTKRIAEKNAAPKTEKTD